MFDENEAMFASSSLDRTIKIWKPMSDDTLDTGLNTLRPTNASPGFKQYKPNTSPRDLSPSNSHTVSPRLSIDKEKY